MGASGLRQVARQSQWRVREGFSPSSLLAPQFSQGAPEAIFRGVLYEMMFLPVNDFLAGYWGGGTRHFVLHPTSH